MFLSISVGCGRAGLSGQNEDLVDVEIIRGLAGASLKSQIPLDEFPMVLKRLVTKLDPEFPIYQVRFINEENTPVGLSKELSLAEGKKQLKLTAVFDDRQVMMTGAEILAAGLENTPYCYVDRLRESLIADAYLFNDPHQIQFLAVYESEDITPSLFLMSPGWWTGWFYDYIRFAIVEKKISQLTVDLEMLNLAAGRNVFDSEESARHKFKSSIRYVNKLQVCEITVKEGDDSFDYDPKRDIKRPVNFVTSVPPFWVVVLDPFGNYRSFEAFVEREQLEKFLKDFEGRVVGQSDDLYVVLGK